MSISHIHVLLLSTAISLIVSFAFSPSWSPVRVLKLPNNTIESAATKEKEQQDNGNNKRRDPTTWPRIEVGSG